MTPVTKAFWISAPIIINICRSQCEELRSTMSKRTQDEVSAELVFQMKEKLDSQKQKEEEEKMYADLWEADMMAKVSGV